VEDVVKIQEEPEHLGPTNDADAGDIRSAKRG